MDRICSDICSPYFWLMSRIFREVVNPVFYLELALRARQPWDDFPGLCEDISWEVPGPPVMVGKFQWALFCNTDQFCNQLQYFCSLEDPWSNAACIVPFPGSRAWVSTFRVRPSNNGTCCRRCCKMRHKSSTMIEWNFSVAFRLQHSKIFSAWFYILLR